MAEYDSIKLEENLEDFIYKLINCYIVFSKTKTFPSSVFSIHRNLVLKYRNKIPLNIVDFFQDLKDKNLKEIFGPSDSNNPLLIELFETAIFKNKQLSEIA